MNAARPAYLIVQVEIHDAEGMAPYRVGVEATLQAFGGVRLAADPAPQAVEGEPPRGMVVLLRFPSLEAAHAWHASPAYQVLLPHRLASSSSRLHLIEGLPA